MPPAIASLGRDEYYNLLETTSDLVGMSTVWMRFVREQFYLAAAAHNLKRLVRFLSHKSTPQMATA